MSQKALKSERIYDGRVVSLRVDTIAIDGKPFQREIVEHNGSVGIIALTDDEKIVLVRQRRAAIDENLLEIPAGTLHKGEDPRAAALRELTEETNLSAAHLEAAFFAYLAPGYSNEGMSFFIARNLTPAKGQQDEDEDVRVESTGLAHALEMVLSGQIRDIKTVAAILYAAVKR